MQLEMVGFDFFQEIVLIIRYQFSIIITENDQKLFDLLQVHLKNLLIIPDICPKHVSNNKFRV